MNDSIETSPEQLHLIESGSQPRVEAELLRELLTSDAGPQPGVAGIYSYKHRLHALRCENTYLRLRTQELEFQIKEMRSTRGWKLLEIIRGWRRSVLGWFHPSTNANKTE